MADDRYGGRGRREGWRGRDDSIFSDEEDRWSRGSGRWSSDHGREREQGDERGFFERAGDEVRSWFGDEEAERRRERDVRPDEGRGDFDRSPASGRGVSSGTGTTHGQSGGDFPRAGSEGRGQRDRFVSQRSFGGGSSGLGGGRSQWDDHYRQWRDRQIEQFDREYEDYCRERQQRFEQDFDSWRGSRLTEGGTAGQFGGASSGETLQAPGGGSGRTRNQGAAAGTTGPLGTETAGTAASGSGSAMEPNAGSQSGGRGGRTRN